MLAVLGLRSKAALAHHRFILSVSHNTIDKEDDDDDDDERRTRQSLSCRPETTVLRCRSRNLALVMVIVVAAICLVPEFPPPRDTVNALRPELRSYLGMVPSEPPWEILWCIFVYMKNGS